VTCLKEIGDYLHRVREEKNISLKEVQEATKISMRYLEAIDRGDLEGIPGEVYRKGFLVNFANAIGLNGQEVLQKYYQMKSAEEEKLLQAQTQIQTQTKNQAQNQAQAQTQTQVIAKESRTVPPHAAADEEQLKGLYLGIVVALIGILIVASFFLFPSYRNNPMDETGISTVDTVEEDDFITDIEATPELIAPITVNAVFKENVWVQVKSDGNYLYGVDGMNFGPSQPQQVWTAQHEMIIKMGNPAGLILNFNGKDLGQLGERGKIKAVKLTPRGLEAL
jgi:transcriptional regulator with XRE-family HTH domain